MLDLQLFCLGERLVVRWDVHMIPLIAHVEEAIPNHAGKLFDHAMADWAYAFLASGNLCERSTRRREGTVRVEEGSRG